MKAPGHKKGYTDREPLNNTIQTEPAAFPVRGTVPFYFRDRLIRNPLGYFFPHTHNLLDI